MHGHRISVRFGRALLAQLAEPVPGGPFVDGLAELAKRHGIYIASGITERDDAAGKIFNSGILFDRGGNVALHYHKQFLATHDQNWFAFGECGNPVVDTDLGRLGLLICFDGRIPEIARSLALQGAEVLVDMANFFAMDQAEMWGPARAYENGVWLVAATKAGYERSIYYPGGSMIVDPRGRVIARIPYDTHAIAVAEIDLEMAHDKRIYAANDKFADRRPEIYGVLSLLMPRPRSRTWRGPRSFPRKRPPRWRRCKCMSRMRSTARMSSPWSTTQPSSA